MSAVVLVQHSIGADDLLGTLFWNSMRVVHWSHRLWRGYDKLQIYSNPDNFLKLAAGHLVNWIAGDKLLVRLGAHAVLVARRITQFLESAQGVKRAGKQLWDAICGRYRLPEKYCWKKGQGGLSPSTTAHLYYLKDRIAGYAASIAYHMLRVVKKVGLLVMRIMDAIDTFYISRASSLESVGEFFVHWSDSMKKLVDNKDLLLDSLQRNRLLIERIFIGLSSPYSVDLIISAVENVLDTMETVHSGVENVSKSVGEVAVDAGKRALLGAAASMNMARYLPSECVPPVEAPWVVIAQRQRRERFPPIEMVTCLQPRKKEISPKVGFFAFFSKQKSIIEMCHAHVVKQLSS
ncbi:MAG: hypothetical protein H7A37_06085 [Chlamydiales bacterium]|nr:hypothetical protein [Chlamydiales bacterium]